MDNNIKNDILDIINNIPSNITLLEKVRWIYIKLGRILAFDYREFNRNKAANLNSNYIDKYETCVQISLLLNEILNNLDPNIKSEIVERKINFKPREREHVASLVTINDEKYLLDLTLDLYRIHYNLSTLQFGYDVYKDSDIIPKQDAIQMDKKLGLTNEYTDNQIDNIRYNLSFMDFSKMSFEEEIDYRLSLVKGIISSNDTYSESNQFINTVILNNILKCQTFRTIIRNKNEQKYIYIFEKNNQLTWYIFDEQNRFYKSNQEEIIYLLNNGWTNRSGNIYNYLTQSNKKL